MIGERSWGRIFIRERSWGRIFILDFDDLSSNLCLFGVSGPGEIRFSSYQISR